MLTHGKSHPQVAVNTSQLAFQQGSNVFLLYENCYMIYTFTLLLQIMLSNVRGRRTSST